MIIKGKKTPDGLKGFSININTVDRWILNATHRASLRRCFHEMFDFKSLQSNKNKNLNKSRIKKDNEDIKGSIEVSKEKFIQPFSNSESVCISNDLAASEDVSDMKQVLIDKLEEGANY